MILKAGVDARGIQPELALGLMIANSVYLGAGYELVVTALVDGSHMQTSLHYNGLAADLRLPAIGTAAVQDLVKKLKNALGAQWDVVLEGADTPGSTGAHIHMEFDPKTPARPAIKT